MDKCSNDKHRENLTSEKHIHVGDDLIMNND